MTTDPQKGEAAKRDSVISCLSKGGHEKLLMTKMRVSPEMRNYFREIGRRGGLRRSERKRASGRRNIAIASSAKWRRFEERQLVRSLVLYANTGLPDFYGGE
jgi:hypothetical protein